MRSGDKCNTLMATQKLVNGTQSLYSNALSQSQWKMITCSWHREWWGQCAAWKAFSIVLFGLERPGETVDYLWIVKALPNQRIVHDFQATFEKQSWNQVVDILGTKIETQHKTLRKNSASVGGHFNKEKSRVLWKQYQPCSSGVLQCTHISTHRCYHATH